MIVNKFHGNQHTVVEAPDTARRRLNHLVSSSGSINDSTNVSTNDSTSARASEVGVSVNSGAGKHAVNSSIRSRSSAPGRGSRRLAGKPVEKKSLKRNTMLKKNQNKNAEQQRQQQQQQQQHQLLLQQIQQRQQQHQQQQQQVIKLYTNT